MGFFRIFYFLKRILYKIPKKILIYLLIFVIYFVFLFSPSSHASQVEVENLPNHDVVQSYRLHTDTLWYKYIYSSILYAKSHNNTFDANLVDYFGKITSSNTQYVFGVYDTNYYALYFTSNGQSFSYKYDRLAFCIADEDNYVSNSSIIIPTANNPGSGELYSSVYQPAIVHILSGSDFYFNLPNCRIEIIDAFKNYIPSDLYDIVYSIGNNTFSFTNDNQVLQEISQKIDETNEQLEQMNDFFNSDTTPTITNSDLPSDTMIDVTSSGFDGIFTKIYNAFTAQGFETINITIPYLNYTFSVSSDFTRLAIRHFTSNIGTYSFENFFYLLWYFAFSRYIVLDIYKYINDIKNGNISKTDTNIKADML